MKTICPHCWQEYPDTPDEYLGMSSECLTCHRDFIVEKTVVCLECGAANAKSATKCRRCGRLFRTRTVSPWQKISLQRPAAAVPPTRSVPRTSAASARQPGKGSSQKSSMGPRAQDGAKKRSSLPKLIGILLLVQFVVVPIVYPHLDPNFKKSRKTTQTRKSSNDGGTALEKGLRYCNEKNYVEAAKWFRTAAEQGDAEGQYYLGCCYELGFGVERNRSEADKWYFKAKEQGHKDGLRAYMEGLWRAYGH